MAAMRDTSKLPSGEKASLSQGLGKQGRGKQTHCSTLSRAASNYATSASQSCLKSLGSSARILVGNAGDHPLVLQLLAQAHQRPLAEDFQSRLDEPCYEPSDRLLVEREHQLIGHVQVSKQIGWFCRQRYPLAMFQDFFTLPEYEAANYDSSLLEVAESVATREGSMLALVRTKRPEWFRQHGWSCCLAQGCTRANTRSILSHLDSQTVKRRLQGSSVEIRTWRHFELEALRRVHRQVTPNMWGSLHRSEENWQWLTGRKAQDQILIAVKSFKNKSEDLTSEPNILGYAVVRDACIVEMVTLEDRIAIRPMLVARACRDAIDRNHHFVSLHTPANDPMHELLVTAGGSWVSEVEALEGKWMLKLLSPERWFEQLYPLLQQRAAAKGIARPIEIEIQCDDIPQRLRLTRRSSRLEKCSNGFPKPHVRCNRQTFQDLLTSNLILPQAIAQGRIKVSNNEVLQTLAALFPPKILWQSPFPLLRL